MNTPTEWSMLQRLQVALRGLDQNDTPAQALRSLVRQGLARLPLPGSGQTLQRWQALAAVAQHDLSLAKLYEGHTDALAIMGELGAAGGDPQGTWGTWAAEAPEGRTLIQSGRDRGVTLHGAKCWCSGAADVDHGLLTAWFGDGRGPQLVRLAMDQGAISFDTGAWRAVGMAGSVSIDVAFRGALGDLVGGTADYLSRPGFWQGGAGIAACWYGGALALGTALADVVKGSPAPARQAFRLAALGKIDVSLQATALVLRDAARWIDAHPRADASAVALRARLAAEASAQQVLAEAGRALGAGAFCRDAHFARMAADLPVFVRQSHAERDFAALGERVALREDPAWAL